MREFRHRAAHSRFGLLTVFIPVALNIFTNYFNQLAGTEIDFPRVDAGHVQCV